MFPISCLDVFSTRRLLSNVGQKVTHHCYCGGNSFYVTIIEITVLLSPTSMPLAVFGEFHYCSNEKKRLNGYEEPLV